MPTKIEWATETWNPITGGRWHNLVVIEDYEGGKPCYERKGKN